MPLSAREMEKVRTLKGELVLVTRALAILGDR